MRRVIMGKRKTRQQKNYEIAKKILEDGYYDSREERKAPKKSG